MWVVHDAFFPAWKEQWGEFGSNFTMEKPMQFSINSGKKNWPHISLSSCEENGTLSLWSLHHTPPKIHNSSLMYAENNRQLTVEGHSTNINIPSKSPRSSKTRKVWPILQLNGTSEDTATETNKLLWSPRPKQ